MCLSILVVPTHAADDTHRHPLSSDTTDIDWELLPTDTYELVEGNYYLTNDYSPGKLLTAATGDEVEICLNGHTLSATSEMMLINQKSDITISDCSTDKKGCLKNQSKSSSVYLIEIEGDDDSYAYGYLSLSNCRLNGSAGIDSYGIIVATNVTAEVTGAFLQQRANDIFTRAVIRDSQIQSEGTAIYSKGRLTLSDTTVTAKEYGISCQSTTNIYDGSISGKTADIYLQSGTLNLYGKVQLKTIKMLDGTICANASGTQPLEVTEPIEISIPESTKVSDNLIGKAVVTDAEPGQFVLADSTETRKLVYDAESKSYIYEARLSDIASGTVSGSGLQWTLDGYGKLTISGNGAIPDASTTSKLPWDYYSNKIKEVVIEDGCTQVGKNAFKEYTNLEHVRFENANTLQLKDCAFQFCTALRSIEFAGTGIVQPDEFVFQECTALPSVHIPATMQMNGKYSGIGSGYSMFSGCSGLQTAVVDCAYIGPFMFECRNIQKITFTDKNVKFYCLENDGEGHPINVSGTAVTAMVGHTCSEVQKLVNERPSYIKLQFVPIENDSGSHRNIVTIPAVDATCTNPGKTEGQKCSACGEILKPQTVVPASDHSFTTRASDRKATDATCTAAATYYVQCDHCDAVSSSKTVPVGKPNDHSFTTKASDKKATDATCTAAATYYVQCDHCDAVSDSKTVPVGKPNDHSFTTKASNKKATDATCTAAATYYVQCDHCDAVSDSKTVPVGEPNDHSFTTKASNKKATDATCTAAATYYVQCDHCDAVSDSKTVPVGEPTGHTPAAAVRENVKTATCTAAGSYDEVVYCSVCQAEISRTPKTIAKIAHDFSNNRAECANGCGTKNPNYVAPPYNPPSPPSPAPTEPEKPENPFVDVKEGDLVYDPVIWAVGKGITSGTTATTFSPDGICTRAEIVTFLWRTSGKPEPAGESNPFSDVTESNYFYKAVLWAVEKGITKGTTASTFSPYDTCTRGQAVTFLYRYAGLPAVANGTHPFSDVTASHYFHDAVIWAVSKAITNGTSATTFSPNDFCTRGQIVTFLYRYLGK